MQKSRSAAARLAIAIAATHLVLSSSKAEEQATDITDVSLTVATDRDLFLEVFINGASTELIGNFKELPDGGLAATAEELTEVGLKPDDAARDGGLIRLDRLPGVSYEVNGPEQQLLVTTGNEARAAKVIDVGPNGKKDRLKPQSGYGAVLNYTLFASSNTLFDDELDLFKGISGAFDARVFSPFGTLGQSFIAGYSDGRFEELVRLNTTLSYSDPERLLTYRAGDFITGGLSWTRPVYLGGLQVERNFALRSDLVTLPLPSFSGTAAVPSTLEVYTQNARTYAGDVTAGPFEVVNMPAFTGAGEARVVLRDSLGRETVATLPYYVSSMLLRKGLFDFSAEVGFPRRNFGIESQDYDERLMGVASARYGLTDWLTIEGHAEGGQELLNGGLGVAFPLGPYGAASLAVAGSRAGGKTGALVNAAIELSYNDWSLYGRVQRTVGDYQDIASITAEPTFSGPGGIPIFDAGVPKAIDQVTLSVPAPLDFSSLNLSYTHLAEADGERSSIVGLSYSQQVFGRATLYASAFQDIEDRDSFGVFAGVSVPFGDNMTASAGIEQGPDGMNLVADAAKAERLENGSVGWRLRTSEGETSNRTAAVSYRSPVARIEGGVQQYDDDVRATAQIDGAIAVAGGGVFATNRIDDAFAVIDVGAPDVDVQFQNRPIGKTDKRGRIIVPELKSYEENSVSIDPSKLPVDADVPATKEVVVPADRSGVVVEFGVSKAPAAALVSFVDPNGNPIPVGVAGSLEGDTEQFVIGYDGEAYVRDLQATNSVVISLDDLTSCRAEFPYEPSPGKQVAIRNVVCQ
ncbi:fimbria/pilus outer membrane usher protein (plasmid) [Sinorhizobium meliloti]|uniref:fimbria/pilus outer membrane usher protein n=1 Tax=Rhizobium meliloti TaxID=382 RepID=UPI002D78B0D6|nr:fimbria/pilus outer membrane usher protein [Sinorhizobium meliloti]WRQ71197.1 fimbria/pilus outer membrane usher protein [Sinorhizobium meliloti]